MACGTTECLWSTRWGAGCTWTASRRPAERGPAGPARSPPPRRSASVTTAPTCPPPPTSSVSTTAPSPPPRSPSSIPALGRFREGSGADVPAANLDRFFAPAAGVDEVVEDGELHQPVRDRVLHQAGP